jgi:hypothetical protein
MKDEPLAGAWLVEMIIAALALLLLGRVLGFPVTVYSAVISLAISGVVIMLCHLIRK